VHSKQCSHEDGTCHDEPAHHAPRAARRACAPRPQPEPEVVLLTGSSCAMFRLGGGGGTVLACGLLAVPAPCVCG